jgi:hypothetical protein
MPRKGRGGDDPAWNEPGLGGDADAPRRPPGSHTDHGQIAWIGEAFWRAMDIVSLTVPRYTSKPKMNANLKYMLRTNDRPTIEASFDFFRADTPGLTLQPSCWDVYFRQRGKYLRLAQRAREGARPGQAVRKAGDIRVDNQRFHVRDPGDVPSDAAILSEGDDDPDDVS